MKRSKTALSCLFVSVVILLPQFSRAQDKEAPRRMIPAVSFFISGDYFSPNFGDVDAAYGTLGQVYTLPEGKDFKDYYTVTGGIKISPVEQQTVRLELGASLYKSQLGNAPYTAQSINFLQMYYGGATYLVNIPTGRASFFLGAGPGYVRLNTQRTYNDRPGVVRVNANLFQLHATGGVDFYQSNGVAFGLEVGYAYATTPYTRSANLDFTLKGVTAGISITVPLINAL